MVKLINILVNYNLTVSKFSELHAVKDESFGEGIAVENLNESHPKTQKKQKKSKKSKNPDSDNLKLSREEIENRKLIHEIIP